MKNITTYLFDFDGTLVNSQRSLTRVFQLSYGAVGVNITHEDTLYLMRVRLEAGYRHFKAPIDKASIKKFSDTIVSTLNDEETLKLTEAFPDTVSVLTSLHQKGCILGIVTSNSKNHVLDVLDFLGIDRNLFQVIIGNGEVKKCKPHPEPVKVAIKALGVKRENVAYVGDGLDDMKSAKRARVTPIQLDRLGEYDDSKHHVIKSLEDLL